MHNYPNASDHALPCHHPLSPPPRTMPTALRNDDQELPRRRRKKEGEPDKDRDSPSSRSDKPRERDGRKKSGSTTKLHRRRSGSRGGELDGERKQKGSSSERLATPGSERKAKRVEVNVPEMERRTSAGLSASEVRPRMSYPTFSKAHSREAVGSLEEARKPSTPAATDTDVGADNEARRRRKSMPVRPQTGDTPPSPPLTADNPEIRRSGSGSSMRKAAADLRDSPGKKEARQSRSGASLKEQRQSYQQSELSSMPGAFPEEEFERKSTPTSGYRRTVSTGSQPATSSNITQTTATDSDATSIAPERKKSGRRTAPPPTLRPLYNDDDDVHSYVDEQPQTPVQEYASHQRSLPSRTPIIDILPSKNNPINSNYTYHSGPSLDSPQSFGMTPTMPSNMPPPPPPPPPMMAPTGPPPRVDYLLKNGGLPSLIPKRLINPSQAQVSSYATYSSPGIGFGHAPLEEYARLFSPLHKRLDDYMQVMRSHGSLAVATGYTSVARRLLDRLSKVFARDISGERCGCVICVSGNGQTPLSDEEDSGISWGEILELVSGRRDLPAWPPFTIAPASTPLDLSGSGGLGISGGVPMQKLDVDVPEEYRDHYIRQNQKTKRAVTSWLAQQPNSSDELGAFAAAPEEADEDTLMFAMLTRLPPSQRNVFIALMHGQTTLNGSRAPTPAERPKESGEVLKKVRGALQRLYRLEKQPRDCEAAMYLLSNPLLHGMLATLAEVNEAEWEILVSGRFDGFLWSGAEMSGASVSQQGSRAPSRNGANGTPFSGRGTPFSGMSGLPSRGPTPLRNAMEASPFPSRAPTPGGLGSVAGGAGAGIAPVQLDEDTELAVLAEVERNLFTDMERFEDAFELLHSRAEVVRQLLRERSAGLAMQSSLRRGSAGEGAFARIGTPATDFEGEDGGGGSEWGWGKFGPREGGGDDAESLAPDDSASQISVNRHHRKRRGERRTPAPLAEEDEGPVEDDRKGRRSKY